MTRIEEQLRATFEEQLTELPATVDPAGTAIAGAGRVRRRRTVALAAAAVVAVLAVAAGVGLIGARDNAQPAPPATPPAKTVPPVEVLTGDTLRLTDGRTLRLPGIGDADDIEIVRGAGGWVYRGDKQHWFMSVNGVSSRLDGSGYLFSPDGTRLAWTTDSGVHTGHIAGDRIVTDRSTRVPDAPAAEPVAWLGGKLVIASICCGGDGGSDGWYDMWDPAAGAFVPDPTPVAQLEGFIPRDAPVRDGTVYAVGSTGDRICVLALDPVRHFRTVHKVCDIADVTAESLLQPSPDGRWLLVAEANPAEFTVVDLTRDAAPLTGCDGIGVDPESPRLTTAIWESGSSALIKAPNGTLTRCTVEGDRVRKSTLDTSGLPKGDYQVVPHRGR
ncbi:MAG: hypothetical protein ACRDT6_17340 [Micromonosporaceae bacterium]